MECPVCKYSYSFAQFCGLTNPVKIVCPRCGTKLKIAGIRVISILVGLAAIVFSIPAIALTDFMPAPTNYIVLIGVGLVFLLLVGYIVYRKCGLDRLE